MKKHNGVIVALTIASLSTMPFVVRAAGAGQDTATIPAQASNPAPTPPPQRLAEGELSAKQLLVLMDTDKNGKVSKQEFMAFMSAEFDRMDKNKDGELDVSELTKPRMRSVAGGHK
jgi:hypothetical protein